MIYFIHNLNLVQHYLSKHYIFILCYSIILSAITSIITYVCDRSLRATWNILAIVPFLTCDPMIPSGKFTSLNTVSSIYLFPIFVPSFPLSLTSIPSDFTHSFSSNQLTPHSTGKRFITGWIMSPAVLRLTLSLQLIMRAQPNSRRHWPSSFHCSVIRYPLPAVRDCFSLYAGIRVKSWYTVH